MALFMHHPDGYIIMNDDVNSLTITLEEFLAYEPAYELPATPVGLVGQAYVPGVYHTLNQYNRNQFNLAIPWTDGDNYLASLPDYIDQHNNPILTLPEVKSQRISAMFTVANTKRLGGVTLFSTTMPSSSVDANALLSYQLAGDTPDGYYLKDINGVHKALELVDLQSYNDGVVELRNLCDINSDDLEAAINACSTVEEVAAVDITAGWPVVPFVPS